MEWLSSRCSALFAFSVHTNLVKDSAMAEKPKAQAPTLEEEDIFEDFADQEQAEQEETGKLRLWEADWDDEDVGDDFAQRLKAELKTAAADGSKDKAEPMQVGR
ncbi:hypothetical protein WJX73_000817 [Symbiochloris irregularis]|uniref:26S proteasome complex subunit SEM1 n=1 Tax=Symbiochloris irregularis TaxID=706552 RepID=A0AAW1PIS8_9CHLO